MRVRCLPVWVGASALAFSLATAVPAFATTGAPVAPVEGTQPPPGTPAPAPGGNTGDGLVDATDPSSDPDEHSNEDWNWDWDGDWDRGSWYWSHESEWDEDWDDHHHNSNCSWDGRFEQDGDRSWAGGDADESDRDEAPTVKPAGAAPTASVESAAAPETASPIEGGPPVDEPAAEGGPSEPAPDVEPDVAAEPGEASLSYLGELSGAGATVALTSTAQPGGPLGVLALLGGLCVVGVATVGRIAPPDAAAQFRRDLKLALRSRRPTP